MNWKWQFFEPKAALLFCNLEETYQRDDDLIIYYLYCCYFASRHCIPSLRFGRIKIVKLSDYFQKVKNTVSTYQKLCQKLQQGKFRTAFPVHQMLTRSKTQAIVFQLRLRDTFQQLIFGTLSIQTVCTVFYMTFSIQLQPIYYFLGKKMISLCHF